MRKGLPKELKDLFLQVDADLFEALFHFYVYMDDRFILRSYFDNVNGVKYYETASSDGGTELWILAQDGDKIDDGIVDEMGHKDGDTWFRQDDVSMWVMMKTAFFAPKSCECPAVLKDLQNKVLPLRDFFESEKLTDELNNSLFFEYFGDGDDDLE